VKTVIAICALALLAGCATNFEKQLDTYKAVELERSKEGSEKYKALSAIATGADASTKQVALQAWQAVAMVEQFGGGNRAREGMPTPPPTMFDKTLQTLSILAPIAGNVYGAYYGKTIAVNASNNAAAVAMNEATQRTAQLGVVRDTGVGVANAVGGGYAGALNAALSRPTYSITTTGNNNTVAGLDATTTTTTNTVECPQTASATGGQSGNAGTGGNSGAPGSAGNGGNSGTAAPPSVTQRTDCSAGK
jgi:hypothetical protein